MLGSGIVVEKVRLEVEADEILFQKLLVHNDVKGYSWRENTFEFHFDFWSYVIVKIWVYLVHANQSFI